MIILILDHIVKVFFSGSILSLPSCSILLKIAVRLKLRHPHPVLKV
jgi:hypothetical protein